MSSVDMVEEAAGGEKPTTAPLLLRTSKPRDDIVIWRCLALFGKLLADGHALEAIAIPLSFLTKVVLQPDWVI